MSHTQQLETPQEILEQGNKWLASLAIQWPDGLATLSAGQKQELCQVAVCRFA